MVRSLALWILVLATPGASRAQSDPAQLPARAEHSGVLVALDSYADAARSKERFGKKHPQAAGLLAVEVIFRNHTNFAIWVGTATIRLLIHPPGSARQRLTALPLDEVVDRLLNRPTPDPTIPRRPLPRRPGPPRDKEWAETEVLVRSVALEFDLLPPQSTLRGFLFFDLNGKFDRLPHARLYIPDLVYVHNREPLMFFEIEFAPPRRPAR